MPNPLLKYFYRSLAIVFCYALGVTFFVANYNPYRWYFDLYVIVLIFVFSWVLVYVYWTLRSGGDEQMHPGSPDFKSQNPERESGLVDSISKSEIDKNIVVKEGYRAKYQKPAEELSTSLIASEAKMDVRGMIQVPEKFMACVDSQNYPQIWPSKSDAGFVAFEEATETVVKGVSERKFFEKLDQVFPSCVSVSGSLPVPGTQIGRVYSPDGIFEFHDVRFVIEVDEPYSGVTRRPTHYENSYDVDRNRVFNESGWMVVRFAEEQIVKQLDECIFFLVDLIRLLDPRAPFSASAQKWPDPIAVWTYDEALKMVEEKYRESYLGISFDVKEEEKPNVIEYSTDTGRKEVPQTNSDVDTTFIRRESGSEVDERSLPAYGDRQSLTRPVSRSSRSSSLGSHSHRSSSSIHTNKAERHSPSALEVKIRDVIASGNHLKFRYGGDIGVVKPQRISTEEEVTYLYGRELVSGKVRKFVLNRIDTLGVKEIVQARQEVESGASYSAISSAIKHVIDHGYVATMHYSKSPGEVKVHRISSVKNSLEYNNCIEAYSEEGNGYLTFSKRKIDSIVVLAVNKWGSSYKLFGHPEDYIENRNIERKSSTTSSGASSYAKEAGSSGCLVFLLLGGGGVLSILYFLI